MKDTITIREYYLTYERVSTEDQTHTKSCADQKTVNDRHISQNDWKLAKNGDYRDEGISGTKLDRPGLQDLLLRCKEDSTIKGIVVTETDRLARGNFAFIPIREMVKKCGVEIVAVTQLMVNDTPEGTMIGEILGAVNGLQVEVTRRKSMRALDEKANRGWYPSKAPLGYKNVNIGTEENPDRTIGVDEAKAVYVRQIPKLYNQGMSYQEITDRFYDEGLRGNATGKVSPEEIRKILFSDFYLGEFVWRGIKHTGNHTPLFSWVEVQKARNRSNEKGHVHSTKDLRDKFIYKKLSFFCPCSCRITAEMKIKHYERTHRTAEYLFYHCTKSKGGWKVCTQPSINKEDLITEFAKKAVFPVDIDLPLAEYMFEEMTKEHEFQREQDHETVKGISIRLGQIDSELRNLFTSKLRGEIPVIEGHNPENVYQEYRLKLEMEHKKLSQAKKKIEEGSKDWKQKASNFFSLCVDATNLFLKANDDKRFPFLKKITSNVFLDNRKLVVTHQFPFSEMAKRTSHPGLLLREDSNL